MSLSDAHYFEEMGVKKYEEIRPLLDSREKKDKLEGMKRLMAMISIGRDGRIGAVLIVLVSLALTPNRLSSFQLLPRRGQAGDQRFAGSQEAGVPVPDTLCRGQIE